MGKEKDKFSLDEYKITFISDKVGATEKELIISAEYLCEQLKILIDSCYTILKVKRIIND